MNSLTSSLDNNMNYTKPKRPLFRGLTEVNVHYQSFPELETSPPGNTRNTANSEVPQYFWDPAPLSPNLAEETAIFQSFTPRGENFVSNYLHESKQLSKSPIIHHQFPKINTNSQHQPW